MNLPAALATRLAVLFMRGCACLPLGLSARIGEGLGVLAKHLLARRRKIVDTNLRLCFPDLSNDARAALRDRHFRILGRSFLEHGLAWWAAPERLRRLVQVQGREHIDRLLAEKTPVILLVPHFVGLDVCATRISMEWNGLSIYTRQKNPIFDRLLHHGRTRFRDARIFPREDGIRPVLRLLRGGEHVLYYLPDLDHGTKDALFVPFFGIPAATLAALPRLAQMAHARVLTCIAEILPGGAGYRVTISPPWEHFPSGNADADVHRMNTEIEAAIRTLPEQYYWVHRRFKTRPEGELNLYR